MDMKEEDNENTIDVAKRLINSKLKIDVKDGDIISAYRVNQTNSDRPKHILIIFKDNETKKSFWFEKIVERKRSNN